MELFRRDDDAYPDTHTITFEAVPHPSHKDDIGEYEGVIGTVKLKVIEADTYGLTLNPSTNLEVVEGGKDKKLQVKLDAEPVGGDVTVKPMPHGNPLLYFRPASLTFSKYNWDTYQTFDVFATDDENAFSSTTEVAFSANGGDFKNVTNSITINVADNGQRDVNFHYLHGDKAGSFSIVEGTTLTYRVSLATKPTGNVTISLTPSRDSDVTFSPNRLSFTTSNWNTPQTVTATAAEDSDRTKDASTLSIVGEGSDYDNFTDIRDISVVDNDIPSIVRDPPGDITVKEGDLITLNLRLSARPEENLTYINNIRSPPGGHSGQITSSLDGNNILNFTPQNWNSPQTLSYLALYDIDDDDHEFQFLGRFSDFPAEFSKLTITENDDTPPLIFSPRKLAILEGESANVTVRLGKKPYHSTSPGATVHPVKIEFIKSADSSDDVKIFNTVPGFTYSTSFTHETWDRTRTLTINTTKDDDDVDDSASYTLSLYGQYYGTAKYTDGLKITVLEKAILTSVSELDIEEGTSENFSVKLAAEPTGNVRVNLVPSDSLASVSPSSLTFTESNWNQVQWVTVSIAEDDNRITETLSIDLTASGDGVYDGKTNRVAISAEDNDIPKFSSIYHITNFGTTQKLIDHLVMDEFSYKVLGIHLRTKPTGNVSVNLSTSGLTGLKVEPTNLSFTPGDWQRLRTFKVRSPEVDNSGSRKTLNISASGADYDGLTTSLPITVENSHGLGISEGQDDYLIIEEGQSKTLTVVLRGELTDTSSNRSLARVDIARDELGRDHSVISDGILSVSPRVLHFDSTNHNQPQTVTITGIEDDDRDDENGNISFLVSYYNPPRGADTSGSLWRAYKQRSGTRIAEIRIKDTTPEPSSIQAGLTLSPSSILRITEGESESFTVVLDKAPVGGDVTVDLTAGDSSVTFSPASLTFTDSNWDTAQSVTVITVKDSNASNESTSVSLTASGADYGSVTKSLPLTIIDLDAKGLSSSVSTLGLTEGSTKEFTVKLISQPSGGNVTVSLTKSGSDDVTISSSSLSFTDSTWNIPQSVTVRAADDSDGVNDTATIALSASGADYANITGSIRIDVTDDDAPGLTIDSSSLDVGEGENDDFTVKLTAAPTGGNVTVAITKSGSPDVTISPSSLTFTPANWGSVQSVTVSAAQDDDAADDSATLSLNASGANYANITGSVDIDVNDNDDRGLTVSSLTLVLSEGSTKDFTVKLTASPTGGNVTVTISKSSGSNDVSFSPASLTFGASNWSTPQTVTVSAADDNDGVKDSASISLSASGADYVSIAGTNVKVDVSDNDVPGLTVNPSKLQQQEGKSKDFTVKLTTAPTGGNVSVTLSKTGSDDVTFSPSSLTFTPSNWGSTQNVSVSAAQDDDAADDVANISLSASGGDYVDVTGSIGIDVSDDDSQEIDTSASTLGIAEGGEKDFTVRLTSEPVGGDVIVTVTKSGSVSVTSSPANLTFSDSNWNTPQTVTVRAAEDPDGVDDTATIDLSASGADYDGVEGEVDANVTDNDTPGLSIDPSSLDMDEGDDETIDVKLTTKPTGNVTISSSKTGSQDVTLSPTSLTFTASNWDSPQTITVSAADDDDGADDTASIVLADSSQEYFSGSGTVNVDVSDDDDLGLNVASTLGLTEGNSKDFTFSLKTQPSGGNVEVDVTKSGSTDITISPASVTFTPSNWNTPQTVTVSAADDNDGVNDSADVSLSASGADYGNISAVVTVTATDNDTLGLTIDPSSLKVTEGSDGTVDIKLAAEPTGGNVTVDLTRSGSDDVTISPTSLTFTTSNWGSAQAVTIGADDDDDGADDTASIALTASGADYGNVTGTLGVEVDDDDDLGLTVSSSTLGLTEGKNKDFTVKLNTQPSGGDVSVDVTVSGSDDVTISPASLTFTTSNWNTPQTVTVSGASDDDGVDDSAEVSLSAKNADYGGISADVDVTVTDNDIPGLTVDPSSLTVEEGESETLGLSLTTEPTSIVTVDLTKSGSDGVTLSLNRLTFNTSNWGSAQNIDVSAASDDDGSDETANISISASGGDYGNVSATVKVKVDDDDPRGLNVSASTLGLTEAGDDKEFTFSLKTKPKGGDVTVNIIKSGSQDVTTSPASVIFTASNWNTPRTVTVSAAEDDDGVNDTANVSLAASGADYGSITVAVKIDVTDKDTPGLTINPSNLDVNEGEDGSFNVNLTTEPIGGTVTVGLTKSGSDDVSFTPSSLTFAASNWSSAQTVTVSAADDDDGIDDTANLSLTASGADYGEVTGKVQVKAVDDDERGLSVSASTLGLTEGGDKDLTLSLKTQPSGDVTITVTKSGSDDVTLSATSLTFTTSNWNTPQSVTVSAATDEDGVNDSASVSLAASGGDYGNITATVSVDVTDKDTPGLTVDPSELDVDEGDDESFNVSLTVKPTGGNVTVALTKSGSQDVTFSPTSLTFTPSNWNSSRAVTVSAAEDDDGADDSATVSLTAQGADYQSVTASVKVDVDDNDPRGLTIDQSTLGLTEGGAKNFSVALKTQPESGNVTVDLIVSGSKDVRVSPSSLIFTSSNWGAPRNVTVNAAEDDDAIKDTANISLAASGADYGGIAGVLKVDITDNDAPGLSIDPASTLEVAEGSTGQLQVSLTVQPSGGDVTVDLTKSGSDDVTLSPASLVFTASDWNSPRYVTVSAAEDDDGVADTASISLAASGADYQGITNNVSVQVIEKQTIELVIDPSIVGLTEGGDGTFTAKLGAQPTGGDVNVYLTKSGSPDVNLSSTHLTFTSSNWNTSQSVTVSADEDDDGVADAATVTLSASGADFNGVTGNVQIQVTDNDAPGLILSSISLPVGEGSAEDLEVQLAVRPSGDVSVSLTKSGSLDVSISPESLSFTPSNWDEAQIVRVSAAEDSDGHSESATLHLAASGADYEGITANVQVQVIENEAFGLNLRPSRVEVREGAESPFTVSLSAQPIWNVSVMIAAGDNPDVTLSPAKLSFTPSDWNRSKTVTVSAAEDDDSDADFTTISLTASGAEFDDITGTVQVTVIDNDAGDISTPQVTYDLILTPDSLDIDEGAGGTFNVRANAISTEEMVIALSAGGSTDVTFDTDPDTDGNQSTLILTPDNWNIDQTITVSAAHDDDAAPDRANASFLDTTGKAIITGRASITVIDDDTAGLTASPATLTIHETSSAIISVQPDTRPLGNVLLSFDNGDADIALSPPNLMFTPSNWRTTRNVTVSGVVDVDETDDDPADVVISASGGGYDGIDTRVSVMVNEADTDSIPEEAIPAFVIAGAPIAIDEGGRRNLHLKLRNRPTAEVTVTVASSGSGLTVDTDTWRQGDQNTMIFSPSNFNGTRVMSVFASEDENTVDENATLSLSAAGGNYEGLVASVSVAIDDNDSPALIISTPSFIDETRARFEVNLSITPSANVSVTLSLPSDIDGVTIDTDLDTPGNQRTLLFTPSNFETGQEVFVATGENFAGDSVTIDLLAAGGNYEGISDSVTVIMGEYTDLGDPRYWWPVKTLALAIPPPTVGDQAVVNIGCRQEGDCEVFLDCSTQEDGVSFRGGLPTPIGAWGIAGIDAQDIADITGASWTSGRLGCALHSQESISAQVWTRSGDGVLVNNSALVRSVNIEGVHLADIESIPGPGERDLSNIRIRCQAPYTKNCTMTTLVCFDDEGSGYAGSLGTIPRHAVKHLQTSELADIIGHRWEGATLGCEMRSDEPFTVQVLTRTGGGGALVNNNATGTLP
ncbi:beta strand repeat-containing protein [Thioalkalivibrio sp. HK1]|uniref:beta strand repeat-containing protein n=1 Tax=Thioalkalivibrio sp. HK1 TaxID=1469245 RepID=UPI0012DECA15|nr:hypothetical protein [Thioalkalivibrio sp. HK1]